MNLETIKTILESGHAWYVRVARLKSRTFWVFLMTWFVLLLLGVLAAETDVRDSITYLHYVPWVLGGILVKSISTDISDTFLARSKDRLKETMLRAEADVEIARISYETEPEEDVPA